MNEVDLWWSRLGADVAPVAAAAWPGSCFSARSGHPLWQSLINLISSTNASSQFSLCSLPSHSIVEVEGRPKSHSGSIREDAAMDSICDLFHHTIERSRFRHAKSNAMFSGG